LYRFAIGSAGANARRVTTLHAARVIGAESAALETILALVDRLPAMICPRCVSTATRPIALDAAALILLVGVP